MINKEIIPAFDLLLDELETIIPELNKQGKQLMDEKKYQEAKNIIEKAELVMAFQVKVKSLRGEWINIGFPLPKSQSTQLTKKKKIKRVSTIKLEEGLRTKNKVFKMPILQAIVDQGGSAKRSIVLKILEESLVDVLNNYDWQPLPSDGRTIRWKSNASWAYTQLKQDGLISDNSPKGIWEITEAGINALKEYKKKAS